MISIRNAAAGDLNGLAVLYLQLSGEQSRPEQMAALLTRILADPAYDLLVAADKTGRVLGTVMGILCCDLVGECRPFMLVENVVVDDACRGEGIGRRLMAHLETHARAHHCSYVILVSGHTRTGAHAFYRAMGYNAQGEARGFKKYL
ncbi:MAG: GNAT family N-acetyltransferase [Eubacteriales bacterium]|nr:GNAT family N-acetyltransferase [Eubacteriales bacterium]